MRREMALARKQLDRRLGPLRGVDLVAPQRGWIRAIRESLGMTMRQLADRAGMAPSRVPVLERAEVTGSATLRSLRRAAEAMNCTFVYAFVPNASLEDILRARVMRQAEREVVRLDHTMRLENQAVLAADLDAQRKRSADLILAGSLRGLWDEEPEGA